MFSLVALSLVSNTNTRLNEGKCCGEGRRLVGAVDVPSFWYEGAAPLGKPSRRPQHRNHLPCHSVGRVNERAAEQPAAQAPPAGAASPEEPPAGAAPPEAPPAGAASPHEHRTGAAPLGKLPSSLIFKTRGSGPVGETAIVPRFGMRERPRWGNCHARTTRARRRGRKWGRGLGRGLAWEGGEGAGREGKQRTSMMKRR